VPHAANLEDIATGRKLGKAEPSVWAGDRSNGGSEKRDLDPGQWLSALGVGDDATNICRKNGSYCGKRSQKKPKRASADPIEKMDAAETSGPLLA